MGSSAAAAAAGARDDAASVRRWRSRARVVVTRASSSSSSSSSSSKNQDFYTLLGVDANATPKEIKSAYRKQALKLHPDVNKSADAAVRFNEVKQAYNVLIDETSRREYDRASSARRASSGTDWAREWAQSASRRASSSSSYSSSSSSSYSSAPPPKEEEFYGFAQFFADLEAELEDKAKKRPKDAPPKTLWEELFEIGEEFVEFLEETAPTPKAKTNAYEAPPKTPPPKPKPSAKSQSVDDMLAQLKRDMGK